MDEKLTDTKIAYMDRGWIRQRYQQMRDIDEYTYITKEKDNTGTAYTQPTETHCSPNEKIQH